MSNNKMIIIQSQNDNEYKIGINQSFWCVCMFAINYEELRNLFLNNKEEFINLYIKCLKEGTDNCKKDINNNIVINNTILFDKFNLSNKIFLTYEKKNLESINDIKILASYKFNIISWDSNSFILINIYGHFLILNSQENIVQFIKDDDVFNYIKNKTDTISNDSYITFYCCA